MDYDINYIETSYDANELNKIFIQEFREKIARIESGYSSPSILSILKILGPIGYTIKIEKVTKKEHNAPRF